MFEDRGKYDFTKYDKNARTQVLVEEQKKQNDLKQQSEAHKKLFNYYDEDIKNQNEFISPLEIRENTQELSDLPSSSYLKQFENKTIENEVIQKNEETAVAKDEDTAKVEVEKNDIDYVSLIESTQETNTNADLVKKELENISPKQKKNFSFRIKLLAGVYVILVVLFGGWVIGNAIDLAQTNAMQYETVTKTEEVSQNIFDIVTSINNLNNASGNPEDETLLVKIATEEIEITPNEIVEPNEYKKESNWFDVFINWFGGIFGGN